MGTPGGRAGSKQFLRGDLAACVGDAFPVGDVEGRLGRPASRYRDVSPLVPLSLQDSLSFQGRFVE